MNSTAYLNLGLTVAVVCALFAACLLGSTPLSAEQVIAAALGFGAPGDTLVVWQIRLPRAMAAFVVGAALGISGAALQGLLRNPLAEPGVLGVSASAALGATTAIYYGLTAAWVYALPLFSILGALLATAILALATTRTSSVVTLILIGVGLSSFAGAAMSLLINFSPHPFSLADMINWSLGSVANRSFDDLAVVAPFLALGFALLAFSREGLMALTLGEEAAAGIGLNLRQQRLLVILGAGISTGAVVAIAGTIGFIGIVAPHLVRPWVRHNPGQSLLPSALLAGLVLLVADIVIRILPTQSELKLGVVAALLGAPVFVWIAYRRNRKGGD